MKILKKILFIGLFSILAIAIYYRELIGYGLLQFKGQLTIVLASKPIEEILKSPTVADSIKQKLLFIQEVRKFAIDSLGLKDSKNYTTFYDQHGLPSMWVITACKPFDMKAYEWTFPLIGSVSYKGFFKKEKGLPELETLRKKGYDTDYGTAGGWSTLGWFKDPVLSSMLRKKEGRLAELIIHELTHATIYLPGSVDYNENLATFVGEQGAKKFLIAKYGITSEELKSYEAYQQDETIFGNYMVDASKKLDSLYKDMDRKKPARINYRIKYFYIKDILLGIKKLPLNNPKKYDMIGPDFKIPNNCFFMSYTRYRKKQDDFERELFKFNGNIRLWMLNLKTINK